MSIVTYYTICLIGYEKVVDPVQHQKIMKESAVCLCKCVLSVVFNLCMCCNVLLIKVLFYYITSTAHYVLRY